jgi:hypothetical protein
MTETEEWLKDKAVFMRAGLYTALAEQGIIKDMTIELFGHTLPCKPRPHTRMEDGQVFVIESLDK